MNKIHVIIIPLLIIISKCLDNGLGKTPQMGWNSWNHFGCNINEQVIKQTVDLLITTGLASKGYKYVNIDDCWQISRNSSTGQIIEDKQKFPNGIASLVEYVHSKGLLFGLYSDAGTFTCQRRPGSYGYETIDANTYAKWKVDYLKYDNCHNQQIPAKIRFPVMRNALNATKRPIFYSMCEWGRQQPHLWAQNVSNSWRTTVDIKDIYQSFILNLELNEKLANYAGPGHWNDPDMLEVGNGGMTNDQYQSHFALWALMKAPLIIGCSLKNISKQTLNILANQQVISVNQDYLGKQGYIIQRQKHNGIIVKQIWYGLLSRNRHVFIFFNRSQKQINFELNLSRYVQQYKIIKLRQIILRKDIQIPKDLILKVQNVRKHAVSMYQVNLQEIQYNLSQQYITI